MKKKGLIAFLCTSLTFVSFPAESSQRMSLDANELTSSLITSSAQDSIGYIWIGTEYGLNKYDGIELTGYYKEDSYKESLLDNSISAIYCDTEGRLWIGMSSGLQMYDHNSDSFKTVAFESDRNRLNVIDIIQSVSGRIWVNIYREGVFEVDPDTMTAKPMTQIIRSCGTSIISHIFIDKNKRVWIGSEDKGIFCMDPENGKVIRYSLDGTSSNNIEHIGENTDGTIIAANDGCIWTLDENSGKFKRMIQPAGTNLYIRDIVLRKNGELIAAAEHQGLWSIDVLNNKIEQINYEKANIVNILEDREGNLWCGCRHKGFMTISDTTETLSLNGIEPVLTNIYFGNRAVKINDLIDNRGRIKLKSENNSLRMTFSTMSMRYPEKISFRYRMSGLEKDWKRTRAGDNWIEYNMLPAGRYTMEVCAEGNDEVSAVWQKKIVVKKSWYYSIPINILYICILCGISILIFREIRRRRREETDERKFYYYANMAHEIRSPMVMIMNPIERLIKSENNPETIHILKIMKRNSQRVLRLMNHFLDSRKLDNGDMTLNIKETDLVGLIKDTLETFAYEAGKREISINFEYPYEKMIFKVDPDHMDTIVFNLVSNAITHTPDNGEVKVTLSMSQEYGNIEISIADTGAGIDEKEINKKFKTGLNLCQELVKLHNGTIWAENRSDKSGAIFTFSIPNLSGEEFTGIKPDGENIRISITESDLRYKPEKKVRVRNQERILIIEDDEETSHYLIEVLSLSYKITTARDGESGLKIALSETPDLIISETKLPGISGLQMIKRIKNNPNTTHIPIILISSTTDINEEMEGLEYGADIYMTKPFNTTILESRIDNLLKNRQRVKGKYSGAHQEDKIKTIEVTSNSDKLMERIMTVINEHLDNPDLNVEMLSSEVGLSRAQLHRKMKEMTGISTGEFIRNIRLKKAAELLAEKKINISQIAYIVGFSSQTHFSTAFRKFYGISPTEYIKNQ